jgi:hypothetical protein
MEKRSEQTFATARCLCPQSWAISGGVEEEREMTIAPLLDTEAAGWGEDRRQRSGQDQDQDRDRDRDRDQGLHGACWPRPTLRLVPDRGPPGPAETQKGAVEPLRGGEDVVRRRARRATIRRRRRAVMLAAVAAGVTCGLALPLASLGGSPVAVHAGAQAAVAGETVYVVRPGDTLWSIASRFDRGGNPRPMAEALAREVGSAVVVPGERIPVP